MEELDLAGADLIKAVRGGSRMFHKISADLQSGRTFRGATSLEPVARGRLSLAEALKRYETARHRARAEIIAMALDEGINISEIARIFGFSRQLAQRYAREARG